LLAIAAVVVIHTRLMLQLQMAVPSTKNPANKSFLKI